MSTLQNLFATDIWMFSERECSVSLRNFQSQNEINVLNEFSSDLNADIPL